MDNKTPVTVIMNSRWGFFLPMKMHNYTKGCDNVKIQRLKLGLTLKQMSEKLGISISQLSAIELGVRPIPKNRQQDFNEHYWGGISE